MTCVTSLFFLSPVEKPQTQAGGPASGLDDRFGADLTRPTAQPHELPYDLLSARVA